MGNCSSLAVLHRPHGQTIRKKNRILTRSDRSSKSQIYLKDAFNLLHVHVGEGQAARGLAQERIFVTGGLFAVYRLADRSTDPPLFRTVTSGNSSALDRRLVSSRLLRPKKEELRQSGCKKKKARITTRRASRRLPPACHSAEKISTKTARVVSRPSIL
jgi:hypothetical protein